MKFDTLNDILRRHKIGVNDRGRIARALPFDIIGPEQLETFLVAYGREALLRGLFEQENGKELVIAQMRGNPH